MVTSFIPYYGSDSKSDKDFTVKGRVGISGGGVANKTRTTKNPVPPLAYQVLSWDLDGLDVRCADGPGMDSDSCGVHVHDLSTTPSIAHPCSQPAGGNYFSTDLGPDPWQKIVYTPTAEGTSKASGVKVTSGREVWDLLDKVVIVHDYDGNRIACGAIEPCQLVAFIIPGVNATCHASVTGEVNVWPKGQGTYGAKQVLAWDLHTVDRRCSLKHCDARFVCQVLRFWLHTALEHGEWTQNHRFSRAFGETRPPGGSKLHRTPVHQPPRVFCIFGKSSRDTQARWSSTRALAATSGSPSLTCRTSRRSTPGLHRCTAAAVPRNMAARCSPVPLSHEARSCRCLV